jgi:hypothetical protein
MAGTGTGGAAPAPAAAPATVLPVVAGHTIKEVTVTHTNNYAGPGNITVKSETYDPRSSKY